MKLLPLTLSLTSAILLALVPAIADDGPIFRKNVSKTPELESENAAIRMLPLYVPPQSSDGVPLTAGIDYNNADGTLVETREYARPLITHYIDGHVDSIDEEGYGGFPGHGERDAFGAVSLDDGATWNRTNLSKSGDLSSFSIQVKKKWVPYPGDVGRSFIASDGNQVLNLKRKKAEYVIFQGFVLSPVPAVIKQARDYGLKAKFMGTHWGTHKMLLDKMGPLAEGYLGVMPYAFYYQDDIPMIKKIRAWNQKHHPDVKYRPTSYMQGFFTGLVFVECLKRADKAGDLSGDGLVKALQSIKDFDVGGLMAPITVVNNKIPMGRVYKANVGKKVFEPISDWIRMD